MWRSNGLNSWPVQPAMYINIQGVNKYGSNQKSCIERQLRRKRIISRLAAASAFSWLGSWHLLAFSAWRLEESR